MAKVISIVVKLTVEGLHHWPECPIEEVSYLKDLHRHIFYITCKKEVSHTDRDIEIIQLKHKIQDFLKQFWWSKEYNCHLFNRMSCEDIASQLVMNFQLNYCQVLEDNENGAEIIETLPEPLPLFGF